MQRATGAARYIVPSLTHILSIINSLEIVYRYINTFTLGAARYTLCHLSPCPALILSLTNTPQIVDIHGLFLHHTVPG